MTVAIWLGALVAYLVFRLWYDGVSKPLTDDEVAHFVSILERRAVGDYVDAWTTPPNPGWHAAGLIRYRSRRDAMLASIAHPAFDGIHKYKIAALKQTYAFPTQTQAALYASPRVTVALVLALGATLLQLALS